ncbi:MAG: hypothetical protein JXB23_18915, partial [Candidatus Aminicenantes bacterium]|nr:hypothetical protein [Candidatus Aminicenantes bacterium]
FVKYYSIKYRFQFAGLFVTLSSCRSSLDYSRVEIAVEARHKGCSCGCPPQILCNEADAVRSARPMGKKCRLKIKSAMRMKKYD